MLTTTTTTGAATVARHADEAMRQIAEDIAAGLVPAGVPSFTALHDHVDANEYLAEVPHDAGDYTLPNAVAAEVNRRLTAQDQTHT